MSEIAVFLGVLFLLGLLGSGVVALLVAIAARSRTKDLEFRLDLARAASDRQEDQLLELKRDLRVLREWLEPQGAAPAEEARPAPPPVAVPPVIAAPPVIAREAPVETPHPEILADVAEAAAPAPEPVAAPPVIETPPESPAAPPPIAPPPAPPARGFDWEGLVGVKLFSWIAGVALALAAVFFLRYSIDQGWLSPVVRSIIGFLGGTCLVIGCELKFARRYSPTANALEGAGLFTLFATAFAAYALWHLIGALPAFVFMALVAGVAVGLSIRRESIFIALLGLLGGFATPALLSTGEDRPFGLFGYLLLLNAGLGWVAYRKRWPVLGLLALAGTTLYQWAWVAKFLAPGKLPIALGVYLVFPLFSVAIHRRDPGEEETGAGAMFRTTLAAGAALPALFAFYLAAVPEYGGRFGLLFGFLAVLVAGLSAVAVARRLPVLHLAAGLSTLLVFALWLALSYTHAAWPAILAITSGFVLLHLAVPLAAHRFEGPLPAALSRTLGLVPALLLFVFPVLAAIEPRAAEPALIFGVLFLLVGILAAYALVRQEGLVHFAAAFFVLAAEAVWSAGHLTRPRLLAALLVYGGFALFYLGVPLLARRLGRTLHPGGSGSLALSGHLFLLFVASQPHLSIPPWPVFGVLLILTLALSVAALATGRGALHLAGLVASQVVLLAWLSVARNAPWPQVGMLATTLLAIVGIAWLFLARRRGLEERTFSDAAIASLFLAEGVAVLGFTAPGAPDIAFLAAFQALLVSALLFVSFTTGRLAVPLFAVPVTAVAVLEYRAEHQGSEAWLAVFALALATALPFLVFPLLLGKRVNAHREPHVTAVLATVPFFFFARHALVQGGYQPVIGLLPLALAAFLLALVQQLLAGERESPRDQGRLALVAGAALAFVTAAIPLQLDREWITIGWALEAAALAWLFRRIPHRGLLHSSGALFVAAFVRLVFNDAVFSYHPRGGMVVFNWYLYTYLVAAAAFFAGSGLFRTTGDDLPDPLPRLSTLLPPGGTVLLFLLLNIEIADYYSIGPSLTFNFLSASLGQDLTYTLGWALFSIALLAFGIARASRAARIAALALLVVTILKCFLHDLWRLGGLYRVSSFVGLAICLALVAVALQRFVLTPARGEGTGK